MNVFRAPFYGPNDQVYRQWSTGNMSGNIYYPYPPVNVLPCGTSRGFVPHNWFDNYYPVMNNIGYGDPRMLGPTWTPSLDSRKTKALGTKISNGFEVSVCKSVVSQEGTKGNQKAGWVPMTKWDCRTSQEQRKHQGNGHPPKPAKLATKDLPARQKPPNRDVCGLCRQNGELFLDHPLKDSEGNVTCPVLFNYVCPYCAATGAKAHTKSHCPLKPTTPLAIKLKTTSRDSCGRIRK